MRFTKAQANGAVFYCIKCLTFHEHTNMESFHDDKAPSASNRWCGRCLKMEIRTMLPEKESWKAAWKNLQEKLFKPVEMKPHLVWSPPKKKEPTPEVNLEI
jgi:ribosomal protein L13